MNRIIIFLSVIIYSFTSYADEVNFCIGTVSQNNGESGVPVKQGVSPPKLFDYGVQIDKGLLIKTSSSSTAYPILSIDDTHMVKIYNGNKIIESFKFNFASYKTTKVCLWFNSFYQTWSLWPYEHSAGHCACK